MVIRKNLLLGSFGGLLEMYDFVIYLFLAASLKQVFYPQSLAFTGLLFIFGVFAIGYVVRPLGGIIFGLVGDRIGRKSTFLFTSLLMASATFLIGCLPDYHSIGALAPILLVIFRLTQGISIGGELPGAIVFITEHSTANKQGFACGVLIGFVNLGIVLASLLTLGLSHLSTNHMVDFGWRVPFWLGGILGFITFYLRRQLTETPVFLNYLRHLEKVQKQSWQCLAVMKTYTLPLISGIVLTLFASLCIVGTFLYIPTFLHALYPSSMLMLANTIAIAVLTLTNIFFGWFADRYNHNTYLRIMILIAVILFFPIFVLLLSGESWRLFLALALLDIFMAAVAAVYPCILIKLFPTQGRYFGLGLCYNIGLALTSLVPLFVTALAHIHPSLWYMPGLLVVVGLVSFISLSFKML